MFENLRFYGLVGLVCFALSFAFCREQRERFVPFPWVATLILIGWIMGASCLIAFGTTPGYSFIESMARCLDIRYFNQLARQDVIGVRGKGILVLMSLAFFVSLFRWCWNWWNRRK